MEKQGKDKVLKYFAWASAALVVLFALAVLEDYMTPWRYYQRMYAEYASVSDGTFPPDNIPDFDYGIRQFYIPKLGAVDRCTSCHIAVDDPRFAEGFEPLRTHPGDYLTKHSQARYGCTSCHGGQGRATTTADAHGRQSSSWTSPILPQPYIQSSCLKCHYMRSPKGMEVASYGRSLVAANNCKLCHFIGDRGGKIGPDLSKIGAAYTLKPVNPIWTSRSYLNPLIGYIRESVAEPSANLAKTVMPKFPLTEVDAASLATYLISFNGNSVPDEYRTMGLSPEDETKLMAGMASDAVAGMAASSQKKATTAEEVLQIRNCMICHILNGQGGLAGGDITKVGEKYAKDRPKLNRWLTNPSLEKPDTTMPNPGLTENEVKMLLDFFYKKK